MGKKSQIKRSDIQTIEQSFENLIANKKMKGLSEKSVTTYQQHFKAMAKYWDVSQSIALVTNQTIEQLIAAMRDSELSTNSISSYCRTLKSFFSYLRSIDKTEIVIPLYKTEETIKKTYTDIELQALLKKPSINKTSFSNYRSWAIINFILNCGCRAATVRNIQIRDIDLADKVVYYRHTKNRKVQAIPLCNEMCAILREYLQYRKGAETDYLFCEIDGTQLTENALRLSIARYNNSRGVDKTSIHLFRHTFAKKYLLECDGDAFTLQKLLGHSTLEMTKHYCTLFNADILKNYDAVCPLNQIKSKGTHISIKK